jgi:glucosamine kinase
MILLADSGSTKTDWTLVTDEAEPIKFQSVGFNPFFQTEDAIYEGLVAQVKPNIVGGTIDKIFYYGTGCADERSSRPVKQALQRLFPEASIDVNSDLLAAARGLCIRSTGIACILGTGSNNGFYNGEVITESIGSLGFWMGDEGSGGNIGKLLVIAYLHNELPEKLALDFKEKYPTVNRLEVLDKAYRQPFPNRYFASYTTFLNEHIDEPFVKNMVQKSFEAFLDKYVLKLSSARTVPVHFTGSVAYYFQDILKNALDKKGLQLGSIQKSPSSGLLLYHTS